MRHAEDLDLSIATTPANQRQWQVTIATALIFLGLTALLWTSAAVIHPAIPAFVPIYQTAIIVAYALTAYLLLPTSLPAASPHYCGSAAARSTPR